MAATVLLGVAVVGSVVFLQDVPLRSDILRDRIVSTLDSRLDRDVSLDDLTLQLFPRFHAEGTGLTIRERGRRDVPPLISIRKFTVDSRVTGLLHKHAAHVTVTGLDITVPPGPEDELEPADTPLVGSPPRSRTGRAVALREGVVIDTLESRDARLVIMPREPSKAPKVWAIHALQMHNVGIAQSMPFTATLTNAIPPGEIETAGTFGPWNRETPGRTPLSGTFRFARADLSVFNGISGTLAAAGDFRGSLGRIDINGQTDTPDFTIKVGGHPFELRAKYHTVVDGTNGDTRLERIDASFLHSTLVAHGSILDQPARVSQRDVVQPGPPARVSQRDGVQPGPPARVSQRDGVQKGRTVMLDIDMPDARVEDIMKMAVKASKPPMTGALQLTTRFLLPPGETDVADRLKLEGRFSIARARFTSYDVQAKIEELSRRSRGLATADMATDKRDERQSVLSNFKGRFALANARLVLPALTFEAPGAQVNLAGVYALKPETLDFHGMLLMDAKLSETEKGFKSLLLKMIDPLFKKPGGGSAIPIKINGKREDPRFGVDVARIFKRGDSF